MKTKFLTLRSFTLLLVMALSIGSAWGKDETYVFNENGTGSGSGTSYSITWDGGSSCTITQTKGSSNTNVSSSYINTARWYQNHLIAFTPKTGVTITKIVITAGSDSNTGQTMTFSTGSGTITNTSTKVTTITGSWSSEVVIKMGSQCRAPSVVITYTSGSSVKHGVNWYVNGTKAQTDSVAEGAAITLPTNPTAPSSCSSKSFYGWTTSSSYSHATDAPEIISSPTMDKSDLNYYAVFADVTGNPSNYVKGSSSDLQTGKKVVLVHPGTTNYAVSSVSSKTNYLDGVSVSISSSTISSPNSNIIWNVTKNNTQYKFNQGASKILRVNSSGLYASSTDASFTISTRSSSYELKDASASYYIDYWGSDGFTTYSSSHNDNCIDFYIQNGSYSNYVTTCKSCEHLITITKGTPSHGSFDMTGGGSNICVDDATASVSLSNITADSHYHATAVTTSAASGGGTPSAISEGSATVTGISATTTINVTFEEDTKYTVTFFNNGKKVESIGTSGVKTYYAGETLGELPGQGDMEPCHTTSTTFMGWMNSDTGISTPQKDAPTMVTSSTVVNDNMTLRAVWAKAQ